MNIKIFGIIITLLFSIIGIFTSNWTEYKQTIFGFSMKSSIGLFKYSTPNDSGFISSLLKDQKTNLPFIKFFAILSLILIIVSLILIFLKINNLSMIILLLSAVFSITSIILWSTDKNLKPINGGGSNIFGDTNKEPNTDIPSDENLLSIKSSYGYSWYLELFSGILAIILFTFSLKKP